MSGALAPKHALLWPVRHRICLKVNSLKTNWQREASATTLPGDPGGKTHMAAHTARVAILDDDQSVRTAIGRLLKTSNLAATPHPTCIDFLQSLERGWPDCLILDLHMPDMDGIDVMNYLRYKHVAVPTIVISAHDGPNIRETCLGLGATTYLRKPLDADQLLQAIEEAVHPAGEATPLPH